MKIKPSLAVSAMSIALLTPMSASADDNLLQGDVRLACEAVLCLSSGDRPSECANSLRRYFSIKFKKPHDTIKARVNFLKLCPTSKEPNMPQLIDALANGAGRCDAAELNRVMQQTYRVRECKTYKHGHERSESCQWVTKSYVRNAMPSYCSAYFNHEWTTVGSKIRFVGTEKKDGRWVDVK